MKFEVHLGKKTRVVELQKNTASWSIMLDGKAIQADITEIEPNTFSFLVNGQSHEIRVTPLADGTLTLQTAHEEFAVEIFDSRAWRGRRHGHLEAEGRQQVVAPMPGKVVRVLVRAGDEVETGQGLVVVEAMKMQNEVRSPKSGTVEQLLAREGQPVNAGEVLVVVA